MSIYKLDIPQATVLITIISLIQRKVVFLLVSFFGYYYLNNKIDMIKPNHLCFIIVGLLFQPENETTKLIPIQR